MNKKNENHPDKKPQKDERTLRFDNKNMRKMNNKKTFLSQNQLNYSQEHKNSIEQSPSTNKT